MDKKKILNISWKQLYVCTALIGALAFVLVYGVKIIDPTYDDWLLSGGDLSQHYIGWKAYRNCDWKFPIGMTDMLSYPNDVSVIFTDSIPILAVFFKVLSPILPETFQYFGIWGVMCFVLQGMLSAMILREFNITKLQTAVASIAFVVAPIVIYRMYMHTSLAGQWLILWAILLLVRHKRIYNNIWGMCGVWAAIGAVAASVHIYFLPMCGIVLAGFAIASFMRERKFRFGYIFPILTYCASAFAVIYILGGGIDGRKA